MRPWIVLAFALSATACQSDDDTGTSGDALSCDGFDDQTSNQTVSVVFRNQGTQPVFLHTASTFDPGARFTISDGSGADVGLPFGNCVPTCASFAAGPVNCDAGISFAKVIRIDPGGTYQEAWNGLVTIQRTMPAACYNEASAPQASCAQLQKPATGSYQAHAMAGTSCPDCICTPDATGSCINFGQALTEAGTIPAVSGEALVASAEVTLPGATEIELVFAPTADGG
jgi:hypothetical protein